MSSDEKTMAGNTWDAYANSSSVHGIRFTSPGHTKYRRIAWSSLLFTGLSILVGFVTSAVVEYLRFEVNTIVTVVSERETSFPAVTLCNLNALRKSKFNEARGDPKYYQMLVLAKILSMTDLTGANENVTIPNIDGKNVREMYQYFGHNMNPFQRGGMLLNCTYRNSPCNGSFFKPVLTNLGQCYTFNPGGKFGTERYGKEVLTATQPGSSFGLALRMTAQSDDYVLMPTQEFSVGWKIFIHDQKELPLAADYGFALSPGTHTFVGLVKRKIINLEPPYTTACRKEPLESGDAYSLKGCVHLCMEKYVRNQCNCYSPISFLDVEGAQLCGLERSIKCVLPALTSFRKYGNNCVCPDPCEAVEYTPYLSYAYFPSDVYAVEVANHLVNVGVARSNASALHYLRKNIIELDVFFQQMNHMVVKQIPAKTLRDIYSELGGLLGASLGASFLTFIEFLDFICTRISRRLEKKRANIIKVKSFENETSFGNKENN